jgi:hypothetical protein
MTMETFNARFQIKDARITRVKELPKVCFLGVSAQSGKFPSFYDIVVFQPPSFPLEEGLAVTINGELSMRKPKDGVGKYELQLIARSITKGDDASAPRPRRSTDGPPRSPARSQREEEQPSDDDYPPF